MVAPEVWEQQSWRGKRSFISNLKVPFGLICNQIKGESARKSSLVIIAVVTLFRTFALGERRELAIVLPPARTALCLLPPAITSSIVVVTTPAESSMY